MTQIEHSRATGWVAWVLFGALLLFLLGVLHAVIGLTALLRPEILAGGRAELALSLPLTALAWLHLVIGALAVITGVGLLGGSRWARIMAIQLGCLSAVVNFAFLPISPAWSIIALLFTTLIVYAVAVHGPELAEARGKDRL